MHFLGNDLLYKKNLQENFIEDGILDNFCLKLFLKFVLVSEILPKNVQIMRVTVSMKRTMVMLLTSERFVVQKKL